MKYIYCQDIHIKGINPVNRLGNYYKDILDKIKEIVSIAKDLKVDSVLFGGDLFDSPVVSNTIVDDIIDIIEESQICWHCIYGNHDLIGNRIETSKASSLSHMFRRSKYIKHLNILRDTSGAVIEGFDYNPEIENRLSQYGLKTKHVGGFPKIAVIHAMITNRELHPNILQVNTKKLITDFDLILVGHNHCYWKEEKDINKFYDVGCIGRTGIDEIKVKPKILFFDTDHIDDIKEIELKKVKTPELAFDLDKVALYKSSRDDMINFINSIKTVKFQGLDLRGIISHLGKENQIEDSIINDIIERVGRYEND